MHTSVTVLTLCVFVCPPFFGFHQMFIQHFDNGNFVLNAKDFQLTDFSEKASRVTAFFAHFTT